jgi:uncharacterized membrane protein
MKKTSKQLPSNEKELKNFGFIMGGFIILIFGVIPIVYFETGITVLPWLLGACFIILSLKVPLVLKPAYKAWMKFGLIMNTITTPILLGIVYYFVLTPIGLTMRLFGKDIMQLKPDVNNVSYRRRSQSRTRESLEKPF